MSSGPIQLTHPSAGNRMVMEVHGNLSPQKSCIAEMFPPSWHGPRSKGQAVPAPFQPAGHLWWELFALDCGTSSCQRDIPLPQLDRHKGSHRHPRDKLCSAVSAHHHCCAEWEKYSHSVWKTAQSSHGDTFHRNT